MVNNTLQADVTTDPVSLALELDQATQAVLLQAEHHLKAGQADAAEKLYLAILEIEPHQAVANYRLGLLALIAKGAGAALPYFKTALDAAPEHAQYWVHYINALIQDGQQSVAAQVLKLGVLHGLEGVEVEICAGLVQPLLDAPRAAETNAVLAAYKKHNLRKAESLARTLSVRLPLNGFAWKVLGAVLQKSGRADEALPCMQKAARLLPADAVAQNNLASALQAMSRFDEALASRRLAIELDPNNADAHNGMASYLTLLGKLTEAETSLRRAIELTPDFALAHQNLGIVLHNLGRLDEAEASMRRTLAIDPDSTLVHQALLFSLAGDARRSPAYCLDEARKYGKKASQGSKLKFSAWQCAVPPARLKVGFVSGDLKNHPVGYFLQQVLSGLDRASLELIAYPAADHDDDLSRKLRQSFDGWRSLSQLDDDQAARLI
ncbi:MAG TPA: tetratricopeptide repeat protein, partial [Telluria sp.]